MRIERVAAVAALALVVTPSAAATYGWPLKPFDRQHAVRGYFDDPRMEGTGPSSFHFGIDVSGRDGAPVYAVADGTVRLQPDSVALVADNGDRTFSYWHVDPAVVDRAHVSTGDEVGTIKAGFEHVHFAELHGDRYVNPLRPGGIAPYIDTTSPAVAALGATTGDRRVDSAAVRGVVDLVVDAFDTPSPPLPPPPWENVRAAPAYIRWRLVPAGVPGAGWHTAVDFRSYLAPSERFASVYAAGTQLNRPGRPGHLVFYLTRRWDSKRLPDGRYRLQAEVFDSQGNSGRAGVWLTIAN